MTTATEISDDATRSQDEEAQRLYRWERRASIRVRALMSRYYYQERQRIFETREGVVRIISILGGSVAFSKLFGADANWLSLDLQ